eukprot:CAMPEP_0194500456 /NCGR_PEP_ID=MMETSP0253-20130528/18489_1 /TAXON_ID=2966 /ORGANISM="Noctiluca scintillans" /LENGTH=34 /DNA_ID= /DNA_START= /DNA_END= /DNA_ORIENTATION=
MVYGELKTARRMKASPDGSMETCAYEVMLAMRFS